MVADFSNHGPAWINLQWACRNLFVGQKYCLSKRERKGESLSAVSWRFAHVAQNKTFVNVQPHARQRNNIRCRLAPTRNVTHLWFNSTRNLGIFVVFCSTLFWSVRRVVKLTSPHFWAKGCLTRRRARDAIVSVLRRVVSRACSAACSVVLPCDIQTRDT